jgi:hypothetical protein
MLEIPLAQHAQPKRISVRESEGATRQPGFVEETANSHEPAQIN